MYVRESAPTPSPADRLRADIARARSWDELEVLCARLEAACLQGLLEWPLFEDLCQRLQRRARQLPEGSSIPAAALTGDASRCDCCGASQWRDRGGQPVCSTCHPDPLAGRHRRAA